MFIIALAFFVGTSTDVFGQKGKGNGGGQGHGGGNKGGGKQWGGGHGGDKGGGGRQFGGMPPGQQRKAEFGGFQQPKHDRGGWQQPQRQVWRPQPQPQQVWRQPQQVWRQEQRRQVWRQQAPVFDSWADRRGNGKGKGKWKDRGYDSGNRVRVAPPYNPGWVPPGQIRKQQVHERNAIRKAWKDQEKALRRAARVERYVPYVQPSYRTYIDPSNRYDLEPYRYDRYRNRYDNSYQTYGYDADRYYGEPYRYRSGGVIINSPIYVPSTYSYYPSYGSYYPSYGYYDQQPYDYYNYDGGFDWKSMLLRTVIGFVLGNDGNDLGYDSYYSGIPSGYGYMPAGYSNYAVSSGYYPGYVQPAYYSSPMYVSSNYDNGLIGLLPMGDLLGNGFGAGYGSDILQQVLAQGYEQGFSAGWYARDSRLREQYVRNLYYSDDDYYNPYSVTVGENRRIFSEGYALGYQDALAGRQDYAPEFEGNADLFSILMSNVIGRI